MHIEFNSEVQKHYIEVLPTVSLGWWGNKTLLIGWLFWNVIITF